MFIFWSFSMLYICCHSPCLVLSEFPGSVFLWHYFREILIHFCFNYCFCSSSFLLLLAFPLHICYISCSCPPVLRFPFLYFFQSFFCLLFSFRSFYCHILKLWEILSSFVSSLLINLSKTFFIYVSVLVSSIFFCFFLRISIFLHFLACCLVFPLKLLVC